MKRETPIDRACALMGGYAPLAREIGCDRTRVFYWLKTGKAPGEFCRAIEAATGGKVTRYELRPDVFGPAPKGRVA